MFKGTAQLKKVGTAVGLAFLMAVAVPAIGEASFGEELSDEGREYGHVDQTGDLKVLSQGDEGTIVTSLQEELKDLGHYDSEIDGIFGPITHQAVKNFQTDQNIGVDGLAGPETLSTLWSTTELEVEATAYTASCEGCTGITATGIDLNTNPDQKVIGVDPEVIPLGSTVEVEGYGTAIAGDVGGAIQGNMIDVYKQNHEDAIQWGRQTVTIRVLD